MHFFQNFEIDTNKIHKKDIFFSKIWIRYQKKKQKDHFYKPAAGGKIFRLYKENTEIKRRV